MHYHQNHARGGNVRLSLVMAADGVKENCEPLFIFYDCEAANSQVFTADIIEIAARCYPQVRNTSFESLIYTSQELGKFSMYIVFVLCNEVNYLCTLHKNL